MRTKIFILLLGTSLRICAQSNPNLVPNPSFEDYYSCPTATGILPINGWSEISDCEYFNACNNPPNGNGDFGVPKNLYNINMPNGLAAQDGVGYCGLQTRDIIGLEFLSSSVSLIANVKYDVSFFVSLASTSAFATPLSLALSTNSFFSTDPVSNLQNAIIVSSNSVVDNKGSWLQISSTIIPNSSGQYYLVIGNVYTNNDVPAILPYSSSDYAYYYIDDVTIKEHPGCCPTDLTISNTTLTGTEIFGATNSITVGPNINTDPGADVTLVADNYIEFLPGANLGPGVNAEIGECPGAYQNVSTSPTASTNTAEIITPDGDGNSDQFCVTIIGALQYSVQVSDLLGNIVYVINNANVNSQPQCIWDGTCNFGSLCNNQAVPAAFYILTLTSFGCSGPVISNFLIDVEYPFMRIVNATPQSIDSIINSQLKIFPNPATEKLFIE
ncbi:MAG: hypothetical protein HY064_11075, partial [Bacteroidetes bacterium]|nr:hypothetical protein [Bacteroidota bacterium]